MCSCVRARVYVYVYVACMCVRTILHRRVVERPHHYLTFKPHGRKEGAGRAAGQALDALRRGCGEHERGRNVYKYGVLCYVVCMSSPPSPSFLSLLAYRFRRQYPSWFHMAPMAPCQRDDATLPLPLPLCLCLWLSAATKQRTLLY